MTEQQWFQAADPRPMLEYLRGKASDRKLRLFACAYCRAVRDIQHLSPGSAVTVAERYADGLASDQDLASERRRWACSPEERGPVAPSAYDGAWEAVDWLTILERWRDDPDSYITVPADAVLKRSVLLLRDIFGNPFRPTAVDPAWLAWNAGIIVSLAQAFYDDRAFDQLPILADALEEGGCTNAEILAHCREPGEHARGCGVVDPLLGKE